jgi:hypothetical protein
MSGRLTSLLIVMFLALAPYPFAAQRERQVDPPSLSEKNFFDQLRSLFGRFRETELRRVFDSAQPIRCSQLISDSGEWRPVAFFNEDRKLGDWYHSSLEEVKADLSTYTFKGTCGTDQDSVQLITRFPVRDSLDRYAAGRIPLSEVDVNVNAAVTASFNSRSQAYRFELPYLYSVRGPAGTSSVYSLLAPRTTDHYVTNVTNRWDCKSVRANDVTFLFLICETATLPRNLPRESEATQSFGTYAYFILSDGKEASTTTKLVFGGSRSDESPAAPKVEPEPARPADVPGIESWQIPNTASKLAEIGKSEFRIRFSPQTWTNKLSSPQVLSDQKMSSFDSSKPPAGDYCAWSPATASLVARVLSSNPDAEVAYTLTATDGERLSPASIRFEMKTHNGTRLGTLQCYFARGESAAAVSFDRWVAIVGAHLTLEVAP